MTDTNDDKLAFREFQTLLAEELMIPLEKLTEDASLIDDLQIDSLAMVSMMLRLEESGVDIPMERAWEMQTVGDAYRVYVENLAASA